MHWSFTGNLLAVSFASSVSDNTVQVFQVYKNFMLLNKNNLIFKENEKGEWEPISTLEEEPNL